MFAKIAKTPFSAVRAHFLTFLRKNIKTTPEFFDEKSKTDLGFEIGQPQQKCQRRPTLQFMANPAVNVFCNKDCLITTDNNYYISF